MENEPIIPVAVMLLVLAAGTAIILASWVH